MQPSKEEFLVKAQDMGIHDLRTYAREVGVSSPTTKKRDELIQSIVAILDGKVEASKSNMGRPVKKIKLDDPYQLIESNVFKSNEDIEPEFDENRIMAIKNRSLSLSSSSCRSDLFPVAGIVKRTPKGAFYFKNLDYTTYDGFVFIESSLAFSYCLDSLYYVTGTAKYVQEENVAVLENIMLTNLSLMLTQKCQFIQFHKNIQSTELIVGTDKIEGHSYIEEYPTKEALLNDFISTQSQVSNRYYKINLSLNVDGNTKCKIVNASDNVSISTQPNDSYQTTINLLNDLYNHATMIYNFGRKVLINIIDVSWILTNFYEYEEIKNNKIEALKILEKILNMSVANTDGGSITVVASYIKDERYKDEIEKLKYFCS